MFIKTKAQALREARRRWGKRAIVEDRGWRAATTPAEREAARAELREIREQLKKLHAREVELRGIAYRFQYSVGNLSPYIGAFHVRGQGDTWGEAFADADRREAAAKARAEELVREGNS